MEYFLESQLEQTSRTNARVRDATSAMQWLQQVEQEVNEAYRLPDFLEADIVEDDNGNVTARLPPRVFDIFLSYSSKDALSVAGLYVLLTSHGYVVYLDCLDPLLNPKRVNRGTATTLRRRMVQSRSLMVATSQDTPASSWVPWELGFTDGLTNKAAVLYLASSPTVVFGRSSYFELYPEVGKGAGSRKPTDLQISDPAALPGWSTDWGNWLRWARRY